MPCYYPVDGWRSQTLNASGKRPIVFNPAKGFLDMPLKIGCGSCIGCKLEYARQWAIRCVHEASLHDSNSFITITFNDQCIPSDFSVRVRDLQLFFKRLREALRPIRFRYFSCGEYGGERKRPHYHAIIFGYGFPDRIPCGVNKQGDILYTSALLSSVWPFGFNWIGDVTFQSCGYVSRYVLKKQRGVSEYYICDPDSGESHVQAKEFIVMSRGTGLESDKGTPFFGGIGSEWFRRFGQSDTSKDFITLNGRKMGLPKFYDMLLERVDPLEFATRKGARKYKAILNKEDNTYDRLVVKEECVKSKISLLTRDLE